MSKKTMLDLNLVPWQDEFGLSNVALATVLSVHPDQVSRWRASGRVPGPVVAYCRLYREHEVLRARIRELVS